MKRWIILALMALPGMPVHGADLTMAEAERLALQAEPGIQAAEARAAAHRERAVSAGELPDPRIRMGVMNLPTDTFSLTQVNMTQTQLGVRQAFPSAGSREASSRRFQARARSQGQSAEARRRQVRLRVREAWLDVRYREASLQTLEDDRDLFADLVEVTRALYAEGRRSQQDLIRAQLELSRLDDRMLDVRERIRTARADLARWIGRNEAGRSLAAGWPEWNELVPEPALARRLQDHPSLQAMRERVAAADADIDRARSQYKPSWALDAGYGFRGGRDNLGGSRANFFSLVVSLDVPLFTGDRQDRDVAAAVSEQAAVEADWRDELREMRRDLESGYARWEQLGERIELYEGSVIPQAEAQTEAALLAYQNDTGDFADVMRGHITLLDAHLERLRLMTEQARTWAQLDYLGGMSDA